MIDLARAVWTSPTAEGWDQLLASLNPDHLPPTVPLEVARAAREDAWHPDPLPRSWITDLRRSSHPVEHKTALADLALAVAAANSGAVEVSREQLAEGLHRLGDDSITATRWPLTPQNELQYAVGILQDVGPDWVLRAKPARERWPQSSARYDKYPAWLPSDLGIPTLCSYAADLPVEDSLVELEERLHATHKIGPRQSVHWTGGRECTCGILRCVNAPQLTESMVEQDLYRKVTQLLRAGDADAPRLTRQCRELASLAGRPVPESVDWQLVRGVAARRVLTLEKSAMRPVQRSVLDARPVRPPARPLPAGTPTEVVKAFRGLETALNRAADMWDSPEPPEGEDFEEYRLKFLAGVSPDPEEEDPSVNFLVDQSSWVLETIAEAESAYHAVLDIAADSPPDGCTFAVVLAQLQPYKQLCGDVLGLGPLDARRNDRELFQLGGMAFEVCPPTVHPEQFRLRCRALPEVQYQSLTRVQEQVSRYVHRHKQTEAFRRMEALVAQQVQTLVAVDKATSALHKKQCGGRRRTGSAVARAQILMVELLNIDQEKYRAYTASQWAAELDCSSSTVQKTAEWKSLNHNRHKVQDRSSDRRGTTPVGRKQPDLDDEE